MPVVVSMVVVSILWKIIYDPAMVCSTTSSGSLPLARFKPVNWLGNPATAMPSIIGMSVWQGVGFHMVIWLAGLQTIPAHVV